MKEMFQKPLLELGHISIKAENLLGLAILIMAILIFLTILRKLIHRTDRLDPGKKFSLYKLIRYVMVFLGLIFGLNVLGVNISIILAGSAAFLVVLGFGLQNLFFDFISGIIILLDKTVKVNDIIEINNSIYKVDDIKFRTTTVLGRNEEFIVLPNSELTSNKITNWTYSAVSSRFRVEIGVDYSSDIDLLMSTVVEVAEKHPLVLPSPKPFARFDDYGDSALKFSLYFYTNEVFRVENTKSQIRVAIWKALKQKGITIPFPQRVLHFADGNKFAK